MAASGAPPLMIGMRISFRRFRKPDMSEVELRSSCVSEVGVGEACRSFQYSYRDTEEWNELLHLPGFFADAEQKSRIAG